MMMINNSGEISIEQVCEVAHVVASYMIDYLENNKLTFKNSSLVLTWEVGNMFGFHVRHDDTGEVSPVLCLFRNCLTSWNREDITNIVVGEVRKHFIDKWSAEHHMSEHEKRVQYLKKLAERHKGELLEVWALSNLEQARKEHAQIQSSIDRYLDRCERERMMHTTELYTSGRDQFRSDWLDYEEMYLNRMGVL